MRMIKDFIMLGTLVLLAVTFGCGGSGGGDGSTTGTMSMSITDAKPVLPANVTNCYVEIDEVLVHSSGGGWETLPLVTPSTIDLLQYTNGTTTELVPPVAVETGKYNQIRLSVVRAWLVFDNDDANPVDLDIPSENLKTDKNFDFEVTGIAPAHITIDFDLSQSIVVEGPAGNESYKLKPVLHIVEESATIEGYITNTEIPGSYVVIRVLDSSLQEYTKVQVDKDDTVDATAYSIFWLEPNQAYTVQINYNPESDDTYDESVLIPPDGTLPPGFIYDGLDFPLQTP